MRASGGNSEQIIMHPQIVPERMHDVSQRRLRIARRGRSRQRQRNADLDAVYRQRTVDRAPGNALCDARADCVKRVRGRFRGANKRELLAGDRGHGGDAAMAIRLDDGAVVGGL